MIASSVFVLAALTMTGIYMQSNNVESKDDGYSIDFTALENRTNEKNQEIAQNQKTEPTAAPQQAKAGGSVVLEGEGNMEDDLDYMPMEAGSNLVQIPGLTDGVLGETEKPEADAEPESTKEPEAAASPSSPSSGETVVSGELHFAEADGLLRPLEGETLLPFSMDSSIYFSTLDQYKYNPALMLQAEEGAAVAACAAGNVVDVFQDAEIGHAVTMEIGDGYQITYGQLKEINVSVGSYVEAGELIGQVAQPTKYYSLEGANLYLKLTMDGTPVNPEALFR